MNVFPSGTTLRKYQLGKPKHSFTELARWRPLRRTILRFTENLCSHTKVGWHGEAPPPRILAAHFTVPGRSVISYLQQRGQDFLDTHRFLSESRAGIRRPAIHTGDVHFVRYTSTQNGKNMQL